MTSSTIVKPEESPQKKKGILKHSHHEFVEFSQSKDSILYELQKERERSKRLEADYKRLLKQAS